MFIEQLEATLKQIVDDDDAKVKFWRSYAVQLEHHADHVEDSVIEGYYKRPHATTFCRSCERMAVFDALGYERVIKPDYVSSSIFITGYCIEAKFLALFDVAGIELETGRGYALPGWVMAEGTPHPGLQIQCHPDGMYFGQKQPVAVEFKSVSENTYWSWRGNAKKAGGVVAVRPWYYDQLQLEMASSGAKRSVILYENKNTGRLGEEVVEFDKARWNDLRWFFKDINRIQDPYNWDFLEPYRTVKYKRGKAAGVGIPYAVERKGYNSKTGNTYTHGWDIPTGELELPWECAYCSWYPTCWNREGYDILDDSNRKHIKVAEREEF